MTVLQNISILQPRAKKGLEWLSKLQNAKLAATTANTCRKNKQHRIAHFSNENCGSRKSNTTKKEIRVD